MKSSPALEKLAQTLSIITFIVMCWVAHRTFQVRTQCVNSSFISFVQMDGDRFENCTYESRLSLTGLIKNYPQHKLDDLRKLEVLGPLQGVLAAKAPRLAVEINTQDPRIFEIGRGFIRLGEDWLKDERQTQRALTMGLLKRDQPQNYASEFQLEVMADFLLMTTVGTEVHNHSLAEDVKFPTSAPSFKDYCKSPFRSLAHEEACKEQDPDSTDMQANVWGFRPLMAVALWRMFERAPLTQKMKTMQAIRVGELLPDFPLLKDSSLEGMVQWFEDSLQEQLAALKFKADEHEQYSFKRTMKELEVEAPTHWELTVDITNTPAWKDIVEQFRTWSHFHRQERTLVFTPEGAIAFPSGLPVAWGKQDISSQKHIMIACQWPKPEDVVNIQARHVYARQSCGKIDEIFWN